MKIEEQDWESGRLASTEDFLSQETEDFFQPSPPTGSHAPVNTFRYELVGDSGLPKTTPGETVPPSIQTASSPSNDYFQHYQNKYTPNASYQRSSQYQLDLLKERREKEEEYQKNRKSIRNGCFILAGFLVFLAAATGIFTWVLLQEYDFSNHAQETMAQVVTCQSRHQSGSNKHSTGSTHYYVTVSFDYHNQKITSNEFEIPSEVPAGSRLSVVFHSENPVNCRLNKGSTLDTGKVGRCWVGTVAFGFFFVLLLAALVNEIKKLRRMKPPFDDIRD